MTLMIAMILLPMSLALADTEPVTNPVYTCKFKAGEVVIEQVESSGDVMVKADGQARQYVMDKLKLVPREQGLPTYVFQPELKRWQLLNDRGEAIESTECSAKPSLKTG
ncbi:hypothetical protein AB4099_25495 [Bosea sp. 2KB_26]|uniref:hypothetical protein n=1 Tax=Bosea sp. 2KB_26 TaxID=3237475 RepID=UPI003F8E1FEB